MPDLLHTLPCPAHRQADLHARRAASPAGHERGGDEGLSLSAALEGWKDVISRSFGKLLVLPLLAFAAGKVLGLSGTPLGVCLIFTAVPVSVSSYILARVLGGDHDRMAAIITIQTLAALLSMPLVLGLLL